MKEFEHILECLKLQKKGTAGDKQGIFDISNKERIGKSEVGFCWFIALPLSPLDLLNREIRWSSWSKTNNDLFLNKRNTTPPLRQPYILPKFPQLKR